MNLAIPDVRTLEIHPPTSHTSTCRRSYGVRMRDELGVPLLKSAIRDAAGLGYNFLSIAGEQSVFYPDLAALCRQAHQMRMLTTLTTRAGLLSAARVKSLVHSVDLLGIRYEAGMARNLEPVRRSGIPFALVYHLDAVNIGELETSAAFAVAHGAAMLHVQPAEELCDQTMATVWMMLECLRDMHRGELALQLEVLNRYDLGAGAAAPETWLTQLAAGSNCLGDLISPLVIEETGFVSPLRPGFPQSMGFGSLSETPLADLAARWILDRAPAFCELYRKTVGEARLFGDLHQLLAEEAVRQASPKVVVMRAGGGV